MPVWILQTNCLVDSLVSYSTKKNIYFIYIQLFPFPASKFKEQNGLLLLSLSFLYSISTSASRNSGQTQKNSGCPLCLILWKTMNNHSLLTLWLTSMTTKLSPCFIQAEILGAHWSTALQCVLIRITCATSQFTAWKTMREVREPWVPQSSAQAPLWYLTACIPSLEYLEIHWMGGSFLSFTNILSLGSHWALCNNCHCIPFGLKPV